VLKKKMRKYLILFLLFVISLVFGNDKADYDVNDVSFRGGSTTDTTATDSDPTTDTPTPNTDTSGTTGQPTGGGGVGYTLPEDIFGPKGISAIFLHPDELRQGSRLLPLATAMDNLLKYDAFWAAASIAELHPEAWRTLRTEHPDRLALFYITPVLGRKTTMTSYLDYEYIHQYHPEWFLLKDEKNATAKDYRNPDKRMQWNPDDPRAFFHSFLLDVGNPAFQDWAVNQFLKKLNPESGVNARIRYSGIAADTVILTGFQNDRTALYPNWKYASGGWNQAYFSYLRKLHNALQKQGYILIANHKLNYSSNLDDTNWQNLMAVVDGLMGEEAMLTWSRQTNSFADRLGGDRWERRIRRHEEILEKGLYDWWECNFNYKDPAQDYSNFLYVYCSFLLVRDDDWSLFGVYRRKDGVDLDPWYEEYTLPIGNPEGPRYQRQGCWLRDYQHAKIAVNPSSVRCTISLDSDTYTLDWRTKKKIRQLTLDPLSATILLPTGYPLD
jgi:hypothetical protein